jgi:hypothetical protein
METITQQTKANNIRSKYRDRFHHTSELPPQTDEEIEEQKDPEAYKRRELRKLWKEERPEFKRLERLAVEVKIEKVILTSVRPWGLYGCYISSELCQWDMNSEENAKQCGLSKAQWLSITERKGAVILISRDCDSVHLPRQTLAHEIGHQLCYLAGYTQAEENAPVTKSMCQLFPGDTYVHENGQKEFRAECFSEYLTNPSIKRGIERECEKILSRVRRHNPDAAKLVEQYRRTLLEQIRRAGTPRQ